MHDAAAGAHPLHAARRQQAGIALVVRVAHTPGEHIGDRLEAAVRMARKATDVVGRAVRAELIKEQERIEHVEVALADHARQFHAGAVRGRLAAQHKCDTAAGGGGSCIHGESPGSTATQDAAEAVRVQASARERNGAVGRTITIRHNVEESFVGAPKEGASGAAATNALR